MNFIIYQITNKLNGKIYVGRHSCDCQPCKYMGSGVQIKNAIKKYGIENFEKQVLFSFDTENELIQKEEELVTEEFCKRKDTYNMIVGGPNGIKKGQILSEETRRNMSVAFTGRKYSEKTRSRMSASAKIRQMGDTNSFYGKKHSDEAKKRMSDTQKEISPARGSSWWNNGVSNLKVSRNSSPPDGYVRGRLMKRFHQPGPS